ASEAARSSSTPACRPLPACRCSATKGPISAPSASGSSAWRSGTTLIAPWRNWPRRWTGWHRVRSGVRRGTARGGQSVVPLIRKGLFRMDKHFELARSKRQALGLLLLVTAVFVVTSWLPPSLGVDILKAMAEAAMVGAMADWFAVVALFRRIPVPFIARHTAIIPRNKDSIGENLEVFVSDKFLDPLSLVALLQRHDPLAQLARWLTAPGHAGMLGAQVVRLLSATLDMVQDTQVERFIKHAARTLIGRLDLSHSMATVLAALTQDGRHQALLDAALERLTELLREPASRSVIAQAIVQWVRREHPLKE